MEHETVNITLSIISYYCFAAQRSTLLTSGSAAQVCGQAWLARKK
jgi:hypothetical protein